MEREDWNDMANGRDGGGSQYVATGDMRITPSLKFTGVTTGKIRQFDSGATRDSDDGKHDPEGFLSPLVIDRFNRYMHKHRVQSDGTLRDSDNWQKGMPQDQYMKSMWRHFLDVWTLHRGYVHGPSSDDMEESLCAMLFNVMGYLHEELKDTWGTEA